jgi:hypothetical protein
MEDEFDSVGEKVAAIFKELAGERAKALDGSALPEAITKVITVALAGEEDGEQTFPQKEHIAFHLTDWNSDAAFLVALHLFPERFTPEEISAGISLFLAHVPAHVIAAARLSGHSTEDIFAEVDKERDGR